jgi:hypothetical protein
MVGEHLHGSEGRVAIMPLIEPVFSPMRLELSGLTI